MIISTDINDPISTPDPVGNGALNAISEIDNKNEGPATRCLAEVKLEPLANRLALHGFVRSFRAI